MGEEGKCKGRKGGIEEERDGDNQGTHKKLQAMRIA